MVARKKTRATSDFSWVKQHIGKFFLGAIAASSFVIAFGEGKVSQWISPISSNSACLNQFYRDIPPILAKDSLQKNSYALCFHDFNVMYSGVSKTPLWVSEKLTPQRLSSRIKREDNFHEELRIPEIHRALLSDYRGSGYDRGHMAPNGDMGNSTAQYDSFSLANMVPQAPKNNQQIWRELEEATRALVTKQKQDVYVVTGPVFEGKKLKTIGRGVIVPSAVYKVIYLPKTGAIGAYYAPNDNSLQVKVVSVCYLEEKLGMNLFPQLTEEQKRNVYQLPLNATAVKAQKKLSYLHWDGESQCAEDVEQQTLTTVQKQFTQQKSQATPMEAQGIDDETKQAIIKQLVDALLHYFLQILR
ncbi:DNA/RNA non-specific endonuclease [Acinetobacter sp. S54]|nr:MULTISPECIES: DNA/RNA non-specific endonuclease [unclassified Acinetobacter]MBK0063437.1 DNA/RNA non-specific endonuclease [Acinetobacter sp. S55]MBK0065492.1 DNA/RNA non-specific endonuclease [Acinetobacter sp. S54]